MKRLLLPLLAALALPTPVNANWFGNKTFSIVCGISESKITTSLLGMKFDWKKDEYSYGLFTFNEKDKTASISDYAKQDNLKYGAVDVLSFNESSIKLSRKGKYDSGKEMIATYTINRINGNFNGKYQFVGSRNIYLRRGNCSKSNNKLF